MKSVEKEYDLAKETATKEGFDVVTFNREYNGGLLFLALKSVNLHRYEGYPFYLLIKME